MAGKCSHADSKLTCIDCNESICSHCFVQCPVGFRCKKCGISDNPHAKLSPFAIVQALGVCIAIGFGFGHAMPWINLPWIGCFLCYFAGIIAGRFLKNFIDYRLAQKAGTIIVFGLLIGMALSPLGGWPFAVLTIVRESIAQPEQGMSLFGVLFGLVCSIFSPVLFVIGALTPSVWGERW